MGGFASSVCGVPLTMCTALLFAAPAAAEGGGRLTIRFSGLEERGGQLLLSVADSPALFEGDGRTPFSAAVPVDDDVEVVVFEGVPAGEYAVKVFHDSNENRELDIGLMGPKERFGFSNNVTGFMGPPDFDDAKFAFDGTELTIDIEAR